MNVAIIPARGRSERVPRKNTLIVAGRPLISHTLAHALAAASIHEVLVSTDDPEIAAIASSDGAEVVRRPSTLATSVATTEAAIIHALDHRVASPWPA